MTLLIVGALLIASGWFLTGALCLGGAILSARYSTYRPQDLSELPLTIMVCLAVAGVVLSVAEQLLT